MRRVVAVGVAFGLVTGCSSSPDPTAEQTTAETAPSTPAATPTEVDTDVEVSIDNLEAGGGTVSASGSATVLDGTLISWELVPVDMENMEDFADGAVEVSGGAFDLEVDVADWQPGEVELWVAFQTVLGTTVEQPAEVIAVYGENGQNMTGPNVVEVGGLYRVEATATTSIG